MAYFFKYARNVECKDIDDIAIDIVTNVDINMNNKKPYSYWSTTFEKSLKE